MKRKIKGPLILVSIILIAVLVTYCPIGQHVTLCTDDGKLLYQAFVPRGEKVFILYTHSVNKGLVEDGYEPASGKLILRCSRFRQYGAGIPEPEPGQVFTDHGDYYEISGYDIVMDTQWTFVGRIADHRLRIGEHGPVVHYNELAEPGTRVGLAADAWSILKEIEWRCRRI